VTPRERNVGTYDRISRAFLASLLLVAGRYWVSMDWQILLYLMALLLVIEAATSSCGLYSLFKVNTCERVKTRGQRQTMLISLFLIVMIIVVGSAISSMMTRQAFLDDVLSMEQELSRALNATYPGATNPVAAFEDLNRTSGAFADKYSHYRPVIIRSDSSFAGDLQNISSIMTRARPVFYSGNLTSGRAALQPMVSVLQEMLDRNGLG